MNPIFFNRSMIQRDQVDKREIWNHLMATSILQVFCFPRLVVSDRCRIANKHTLWESLNNGRTQLANSYRIRFWTFVQQAVEFGVSFLASPKKPKSRMSMLLSMSENIPTPWSCFLAVQIVLKSSRWGRESWLLCYVCLPGVSWLLCGSSSRCLGLSAVCDCDFSWSCSLTSFNHFKVCDISVGL